ncbi:kunitz-type serine protease inhibitor taicotoxin [Drosophila obscura]|uniref:kunitz-type serine protease inhibitor taicotoxin n=1 Tax=Drosophila obscura TaxID=7282 RepID=UPI000BA106B6|nr:kunitz-type serine protease inhibitor taicotoxin [Drosophila obscura]
MSRTKPALVWLSLVLLLVVLLLGGLQPIEARFMPPGLPVIPNICKQPPPRSVGICTIQIEGFYYDPATLDCQMYSIGACHSTPGQSFGDIQDCVATCVHGVRRNQDLYVNEG